MNRQPRNRNDVHYLRMCFDQFAFPVRMQTIISQLFSFRYSILSKHRRAIRTYPQHIVFCLVFCIASSQDMAIFSICSAIDAICVGLPFIYMRLHIPHAHREITFNEMSIIRHLCVRSQHIFNYFAAHFNLNFPEICDPYMVDMHRQISLASFESISTLCSEFFIYGMENIVFARMYYFAESHQI